MNRVSWCEAETSFAYVCGVAYTEELHHADGLGFKPGLWAEFIKEIFYFGTCLLTVHADLSTCCLHLSQLSRLTD